VGRILSSMSALAEITSQCVLTCGIVNPPDAARLRDVVYYSSAGFSYLQARELEHVPVQYGPLVRAQDLCDFGKRVQKFGPHDTRPELEAIWPVMAINHSSRIVASQLVKDHLSAKPLFGHVITFGLLGDSGAMRHLFRAYLSVNY
jgi:hypothetical protein